MSEHSTGTYESSTSAVAVHRISRSIEHGGMSRLGLTRERGLRNATGREIVLRVAARKGFIVARIPAPAPIPGTSCLTP